MVARPAMILYYFDAIGRGEPIRLALALAGIPFRDERVTADQWPAYRPKTPFGQLPVLVVDGEPFAQSVAILRYVGGLAGLYPPSADAALPVDMVLEACEAMFQPVGPWFHEPDPGRKQARLDAMVQYDFPNVLSALDRFIFRDRAPFAVGSALSVADLAVYSIVEFVKSGFVAGLPADIAAPYTNVNRVYDHVRRLPKVAEWNRDHAQDL